MLRRMPERAPGRRTMLPANDTSPIGTLMSKIQCQLQAVMM
jgi:hypothetical protein